MRTFIALNLAPELRAAIHRAAEPLREALATGMSWVGEPGLHLTLRFLGEQPLTVVDGIVAALALGVRNARPVSLALGGIGAFPSLGRPRVLWLGVQANTALTALYHEVDAVCVAAGQESEARKFHPHVTLGRVRERATIDTALLARVASTIDFRAVAAAGTVDVMESVLGRGGARHRVVAAIPLGGTAEGS